MGFGGRKATRSNALGGGLEQGKCKRPRMSIPQARFNALEYLCPKQVQTSSNIYIRSKCKSTEHTHDK